VRGKPGLIEVVNLLHRQRNLLIESAQWLDLPVLGRQLRAQLIQFLLAALG
jgi:hypothetical protein